MIPPQSFGDEDKKKDAAAAMSLMRPEFLKTLDSNLWAAWKEIEEVVELTEKDVHDSFGSWLEDDYFLIRAQPRPRPSPSQFPRSQSTALGPRAKARQRPLGIIESRASRKEVL